MARQANLNDIARRLEEDIIFGRLHPRERLIEDALIERFAAKRHVVRQALGELARLGIVRLERNKGASVRYFAADEVEHIYELRELLQERAARRIPLPAAPELIAKLKDIHRRHSEAAECGDLPSVYRINNEFHDAVFGACGNPYLVEAIAHYAALSHAIRSYRISDPVMLSQAREEHAAIIEAMHRGDQDTLVRLCVEHIKPSKEAYLRMLSWRSSGREAEERPTPRSTAFANASPR